MSFANLNEIDLHCPQCNISHLTSLILLETTAIICCKKVPIGVPLLKPFEPAVFSASSPSGWSLLETGMEMVTSFPSWHSMDDQCLERGVPECHKSEGPLGVKTKTGLPGNFCYKVNVIKVKDILGLTSFCSARADAAGSHFRLSNTLIPSLVTLA